MAKDKIPKRKNIRLPAVVETKKQKNWVILFNKRWKILVGVGTLISIAIGSVAVYNTYFKSQKDKFDDEQTLHGTVTSPDLSKNASENFTVLKSTPIFSSGPFTDSLPPVKGIYIKDIDKYLVVAIQLGGHTFICSIQNLYQGIDLFQPIFNGCTNSKLQLVLKNDRLYVSTKFIDFQTENEVGEIQFNQWILYKNAFLNYHDDPDNKFEVIDHKGNIMFSLGYYANPTQCWVYIAGYFVSPTSVIVCNNLELFSAGHRYINEHNNECLKKADSNWNEKALLEISKIKTIFPVSKMP